MTTPLSFDDALDAAVDALMRGEAPAMILARFPEHAEALAPLVQTARNVGDHALDTSPPMPQGLADNFTIVRAAVERARMAADVAPQGAPAGPARWWQRRLTFASLSLPAGAFAVLAFVGMGGAAAAGMAVSGTGVADLPALVQSVASSGDWRSGRDSAARTPGSAVAPTDEATRGVPGAQPTARGPQQESVSGVARDLRGSVFTLEMAGGDPLRVQMDNNTAVSGTLADGAAVTVEGDVTADRTLHARAVSVDAPPLAAPTATPDRGGPQGTPASGDRTPPSADRTPGPKDQTPPGGPITRTPQPTPERPSGGGPPPDAGTPQGQRPEGAGTPRGAGDPGNGNGGGTNKKP